MDRQNLDELQIPEGVRRLLDAEPQAVMRGYVERAQEDQARTFEAFERAGIPRADAALVMLGAVGTRMGDLLAAIPADKRDHYAAHVMALAFTRAERFDRRRSGAH